MVRSGDHLTVDPTGPQPAPEPGGHPLIDAYLATLATRLTGPRRARQAILAELRDGLLAAADTRLEQGLGPDQAARSALAPSAAATVAIAAIVAHLTLLGMLTGQAITAPGTIARVSGLATVPVAL